jgi:hypothetical protein
MTRFTDQLFDDLMREHGPALASTRVAPTPKRHLATRPVLLTAGAGGLAVAATVGTLVASGGTPAYAVTTHPDGTVTLAVYKQSGIAQVNAKLHALGDRVVVVPVGSGCPSITSLPAPAVPAKQISVEASGSSDGPVTVAAQGVPAGDILVVAFETTTTGQFSVQETTTSANGQVHRSESGSAEVRSSTSGQAHGTGGGHAFRATLGSSKLTSAPAPSCVSLPAQPATGGPGGTTVGGTSGSAHSNVSRSSGTGTVTRGGGSDPATSSNG